MNKKTKTSFRVIQQRITRLHDHLASKKITKKEKVFITYLYSKVHELEELLYELNRVMRMEDLTLLFQKGKALSRNNKTRPRKTT